MLACLLEASVPKVGNVHRGADFEDSTFYDFVLSAVAIGGVFDRADSLSVGELIDQSVSATRNLVGTNTNLGMLLLMAPLARCGPGDLPAQIRRSLAGLDLRDRDLVYDAIRKARPGGLGEVHDGDVQNRTLPNSLGLVDAMRLAEERDAIARQYANDFQELLNLVLPAVCSALNGEASLPDGLVHAHLTVMARIPDTLIARKCGWRTAEESRLRAARIVDELPQGSQAYYQAIEELDFWLRSDGHRRNPGTSADLIAAGLFLGIRVGTITRVHLRELLARTRELTGG